MLVDTDAVANVAVRDINAARAFYEGALGLEPIGGMGQDLLVFKSGNSALNVYRSDYAGTNKAAAVTWDVGDIDDTVRSLKAKGVRFEHYDMPDMTLDGDVYVSGDMKVAWFKDPDGNILNIVGH